MSAINRLQGMVERTGAHGVDAYRVEDELIRVLRKAQSLKISGDELIKITRKRVTELTQQTKQLAA